MLESSRMFVIKRSRAGETESRREKVDWNKISKRVRLLADGLDSSVDPDIIAQQVIAGVKNGIHTSELDILAARISHGFTTTHPDYSNLAARLLISNLHKETSDKFSDAIKELYNHIDEKYNEPMPFVSQKVYDIVMANIDLIDSKIINENDFKNYDYFGYKTLENNYLSRVNDKIVERPQYMLMRVSLGIHGDDLERVFETYELMSNKYFTHATPTLFNSGMQTPQLSSCFAAGTPVFTINGVKNIENVEIGDKVITHKNRWKTVTQLHKNELNNRTLYKVNTSKKNYVEVTGNHKFWSVTKESYETQGNPVWNSIETLKIDDYIVSINTEKIDDTTLVKINTKEKITDNLPKYVYTLGVEEDHSYTVNDLICENCYLLNCNDDLDNIMKVVGDCGKLSKHAGGIGIHFTSVRGKGSRIRKTHGVSKGIVPFLKIYNETANAVDQSGRRPGSFAVYLEPWHSDVMGFLELKMNNGNDRERARELFTALWINDVFMERVEADEMWSLMCPDECPGLITSYGEDFRTLYTKYEKEGKYKKQVKAQEVWKLMMASQRQTGVPYVLNKDSSNRRNNQKNLGTLKGSNLCAEILIYTDENETGTCNLASLALGQYVKHTDNGPEYDFKKLHDTVRVVTRNLNKIIDINYYPIPEARNSNLKHRPIAIGVQGLWNAFMEMRLPFTSPEAQDLNKKIFETIYHGFLTESCELAKEEGVYESFVGSPLSQGKFQYDLWNDEVTEWNNRYIDRSDFDKKYRRNYVETSDLWNWTELRQQILIDGVRNSLGVALMPTASTSNIMGFMECFECITSNMYVRRTKAGEFYIVNRYLINDLMKLGLWNDEMKDQITLAEGSIQNIDSIPAELKKLHMTNWEQSQKEVINLSIGRAPFVDHTESHNTYISDPQEKKIHSNLMYKWRAGLKTMSYYLRQQVTGAVKFSVDATKTVKETPEAVLVCTREDPDCESCSG